MNGCQEDGFRAWVHEQVAIKLAMAGTHANFLHCWLLILYIVRMC